MSDRCRDWASCTTLTLLPEKKKSRKSWFREVVEEKAAHGLASSSKENPNSENS
jgi:hypothetical protein